MIVKVKAALGLRFYLPNLAYLADGADLDVKDGSTVGEVLEKIHFPPGAAAITFVNGRRADQGRVLNVNDQIYLAEPMAGG